jgi:predicted metal-dependent TIM-barrel fold hydrolase
MEFIKFAIRWIGSNLAIPFWVVGHIHLTINVYEDLHEILASFGMNIIVALAFWLDWKEQRTKK